MLKYCVLKSLTTATLIFLVMSPAALIPFVFAVFSWRRSAGFSVSQCLAHPLTLGHLFLSFFSINLSFPGKWQFLPTFWVSFFPPYLLQFLLSSLEENLILKRNYALILQCDKSTKVLLDTTLLRRRTYCILDAIY